MELKKAIEILKHFNLWRRGEIDDLNHSPKEIGNAIDAVVKHHEQ